MQTVNTLPLFQTPTNLNNNIPQIQLKNQPNKPPLKDPGLSLLNSLFPDIATEDKELHRARGILGEKGHNLSRNQIKNIVAEIKYLIDSWLDEYERKTFKGLTLNELLSKKQL